ncbi:MAG TPA: cytochrome c oxidase subunit 3 [Terriglobales bacterium]|nr:cytochrome c oxidase subunit 3 [Terriglobales bacterium]
MASTVHEPPRGEAPEAPPERGHSGGGWRNLVPTDGNLRAVQDRSPEPASTGIWVGLAAIAMSFAAFTSALIVRQGGSTDWRHFILPRVLYLNTLALFISSVTLEIARRRFARTSHPVYAASLRALYATLLLGLVFVMGQYAAWLDLRSQGLYLATNPSSSFFYVLTAVHGLHVLGGLAGLIYVIRKLRRSVLRRSTLDAACYYWHFMDILWLYLLWLLWMKL